MKKMMSLLKLNEIVLAFLLFGLLVAHFLGLFDPGMMVSGLMVVFSCAYIGFLWRESVYDERDEYIRAKVDRILYIVTLLLLTAVIVYKAFAHVNYISEILIISLLSFGKIIISYIIKKTS